jgi:hypothetical protein
MIDIGGPNFWPCTSIKANSELNCEIFVGPGSPAVARTVFAQLKPVYLVVFAGLYPIVAFKNSYTESLKAICYKAVELDGEVASIGCIRCNPRSLSTRSGWRSPSRSCRASQLFIARPLSLSLKHLSGHVLSS